MQNHASRLLWKSQIMRKKLAISHFMGKKRADHKSRKYPLPPSVIGGICMAGENIKVSSSARNIGVTFGSHFNLEKHVMNTCKTAFFHLRNMARYGTVCLKTKLRYLFLLLFHPSWIFAMHFCMGYHDQFSIDYSMFKTVLLAWCPELEAQNIHV